MAPEWFYQAKGQQRGPVASSELRRLADSGVVKPDTAVRKGTDGAWAPAKRVRGLFPESDSAPSPAASAPEHWFYKIGDQVCGPVADAELLLKVYDGEIGRDTLVRKSNQEWTKAERLRVLAGFFPTTPVVRYVLAILACGGLFILYAGPVAAVFGWKHGGGAIPMLLLLAAMGAIWRAITKTQKQTKNPISPSRAAAPKSARPHLVSVPEPPLALAPQGQTPPQPVHPAPAVIQPAAPRTRGMHGSLLALLIALGLLPLVAIVIGCVYLYLEVADYGLESRWADAERVILSDSAVYHGLECKYSTSGHPKARGLVVSVRYPAGWERAEGERPHIVQKFSERRANALATRGASILIADVPELAQISEDEVYGELSAMQDPAGEFREMFPPGAQILSVRVTKYDGAPGLLCEYVMQSERAGMQLEIRTICHMVFYRGNLIVLECSVGGPAGSPEIPSLFEESRVLFMRMGNSVVLHDKWRERG